MNTALIGFGLGIASVLQGGLNRKISGNLGLMNATLMNNVVLLAATALLLVVLRARPSFEPGFSWTYFLPGLLGILLVAGIPFAISRGGAVQLFIPLMASQALASLLWDYSVESKPLTTSRVVGSVVALLGAAWATL